MIVRMPHGTIEYDAPLTVAQVALDMGNDVWNDTLCGCVDGVVVDMSYVIKADCSLELLTLSDPRAMQVYQHTAAHMVGQAVKAVFPTSKLAAAPATAEGFWCDVVLASAPDRTALARIQEELDRIIRADLPITREETSRTAAKAMMRRFGEIYRIQRIESMAKGTRVILYHQGDFVDMSCGPHLSHTGQVAQATLVAMSREGDADGRLYRIYGVAFGSKEAARTFASLVRAKSQKRRIVQTK